MVYVIFSVIFRTCFYTICHIILLIVVGRYLYMSSSLNKVQGLVFNFKRLKYCKMHRMLLRQLVFEFRICLKVFYILFWKR